MENNNVIKPVDSKKPDKKWLVLVLIPVWIYVGFMISQYLIIFCLWLLKLLGVNYESMSDSVLETIASAAIYVVMLVIVIGLPWVIFKSKTSRDDVGLSRLPSWLDIIITPAGLIMYLVLTIALSMLMMRFFPSVDLDQAQEIGFNNISQRYEYILAFITLVIMAPIAEEVIFRGYLFSKLKKYFPVWFGIIVTSLMFGFIHGQIRVAVDTFALSIILCLLRQITGSLWSPILLHMAKNGVAYYILFINPILIN